MASREPEARHDDPRGPCAGLRRPDRLRGRRPGASSPARPGVVTAADGRVVWDNDAYAFLDADCPATANPSLWRQGQLPRSRACTRSTDGIYQVRGLDLSNMTLVEGDTRRHRHRPADLHRDAPPPRSALYREHRGDRPVTGGDLHPLPRRPLRRRARASPTASVADPARPPGSWSTRSRRTSTPARR